jgi:hypothetical protein
MQAIAEERGVNLHVGVLVLLHHITTLLPDKFATGPCTYAGKAGPASHENFANQPAVMR